AGAGGQGAHAARGARLRGDLRGAVEAQQRGDDGGDPAAPGGGRRGEGPVGVPDRVRPECQRLAGVHQGRGGCAGAARGRHGGGRRRGAGQDPRDPRRRRDAQAAPGVSVPQQQNRHAHPQPHVQAAGLAALAGAQRRVAGQRVHARGHDGRQLPARQPRVAVARQQLVQVHGDGGAGRHPPRPRAPRVPAAAAVPARGRVGVAVLGGRRAVCAGADPREPRHRPRRGVPARRAGAVRGRGGRGGAARRVPGAGRGGAGRGRRRRGAGAAGRPVRGQRRGGRGGGAGAGAGADGLQRRARAGRDAGVRARDRAREDHPRAGRGRRPGGVRPQAGRRRAGGAAAAGRRRAAAPGRRARAGHGLLRHRRQRRHPPPAAPGRVGRQGRRAPRRRGRPGLRDAAQPRARAAHGGAAVAELQPA
ncbi:hypothetical protein GGH91_005776, partial [Coemansia sp. RSA 2671]